MWTRLRLHSRRPSSLTDDSGPGGHTCDPAPRPLDPAPRGRNSRPQTCQTSAVSRTSPDRSAPRKISRPHACGISAARHAPGHPGRGTLLPAGQARSANPRGRFDHEGCTSRHWSISTALGCRRCRTQSRAAAGTLPNRMCPTTNRATRNGATGRRPGGSRPSGRARPIVLVPHSQTRPAAARPGSSAEPGPDQAQDRRRRPGTSASTRSARVGQSGRSGVDAGLVTGPQQRGPGRSGRHDSWASTARSKPSPRAWATWPGRLTPRRQHGGGDDSNVRGPRSTMSASAPKNASNSRCPDLEVAPVVLSDVHVAEPVTDLRGGDRDVAAVLIDVLPIDQLPSNRTPAVGD